MRPSGGSGGGGSSSSGGGRDPIWGTPRGTPRGSERGGIDWFGRESIGRRSSMGGPDGTGSNPFARGVPTVEPVAESTQAGELFRMAGVAIPSSGTTLMDQAELLREQVKIFSAEVAFCTSNLKRLMDQGSSDPKQEMEIERLKDDLNEKKRQLKVLEERMLASSDLTPDTGAAGMGSEPSMAELSKTIAKLKAVLSEKTIDMEIVSADNRILQDSLKAKTKQNEQLLEEVNVLRVELTRAIGRGGGGGGAHHPHQQGDGEGERGTEKEKAEQAEVRSLMKVSGGVRTERYGCEESTIW